MNWIFQLEEAFSVNPDFWWEVSLWDGNGRGWTPDKGYVPELLSKSKACQYLKDGQTYTPDRYEGWAQYGLWLLYAASPLEGRRDVQITIPQFGTITVEVPRAGAFYVIDEQIGKTAPVFSLRHDHPRRGDSDHGPGPVRRALLPRERKQPSPAPELDPAPASG
jgi:hypothetical protein